VTFAPATIRVFDLKTTGFPPDAEVIEIAAVDVVTRPFALPLIAHSEEWQQCLVRPGRLIPTDSSAVRRLAVDRSGPARELPDRPHDSRVAVCPVVAASGDQPHVAAVLAGEQAEAVDLDLG
jgi:hypothetical protein